MEEGKEMLYARERVVQQMSRDGLTEENITQGTVKNISSRQEDFLFSGEGQPEQAHDRGQNRVYYQPEDSMLTESGLHVTETAPGAGNTVMQEKTVSVPGAAAFIPEQPAEPEILEELSGMPDALPEEFAGFANRIAQINSGNSEKEPDEDTAEEAGGYVDHKNRRMKEEIRQAKKHRNYQLSASGEPETEDDGYGDEEAAGEEEGKEEGKDRKKAESVKQDKRLKEGEKERLKFRKGKEKEEEPDRLKKRRKRLRFEEAREDENGGGEESASAPDEKKKEEKEKKEEGNGGEGEEKTPGRLKFREDNSGSIRKRRLVNAAVQGAGRRFEEGQEEELDPGAVDAYRTGRGTLRGAIYFSRKTRLKQLREETETWEAEEETGRLMEHGKSRQGKAVQDKPGQAGLPDRTAATARLKNGSRYRKEQETVQNLKKAYQRKINQQKSMEIAQNARKGSEFVKVAKAAAIKAAAALKGSILILLFFSILFFLLLFLAGYLLSNLVHMGGAGAGAIYGGLYQSTYSDISDCEGYYRELETDLEEKIANIEDEEEYADCYEFVYDLGHIGHRAVDLASYLATKYTDFTLELCRDELDALFGEMYTLEVETAEEPREREKKDADGNIIYGADGNPVKETFTAEICYVTLTVKPWDEIMEGRLTQEETSRYKVYLLSQGGQQVYGNPLLEDWKEKISSPFGYRIHPITKEKTLHAGVDIAVPVGTPLFSSTGGTVVTARYSDTAGNFIEVLTDSGYMVRYLHLDSIGVSAGDTVEKGALIGATGNTGRSTGPHLHLEVRTPEGKAIDPTFIVANGEGREEEETEP